MVSSKLDIVWRVYTPTKHPYAGAVLSASESDFIEESINRSKPLRTAGPWDPWIKSPFDFPLPVGASFGKRFLPPGYPRNAFYAAYEPTTAVFETAWYFLEFRRASTATFNSPWEARRIFSVHYDPTGAFDVRVLPEEVLNRVLDPTDHEPSHSIAWEKKDAPSILYPYVRTPVPPGGNNVCVFEISCLGHHSLSMADLSYALGDAGNVLIKASISDVPDVISFQAKQTF